MPSNSFMSEVYLRAVFLPLSVDTLFTLLSTSWSWQPLEMRRTEPLTRTTSENLTSSCRQLKKFELIFLILSQSSDIYHHHSGEMAAGLPSLAQDLNSDSLRDVGPFGN